MSLHALANHLQQAGRGDDKVLIHMTPREVKGLQSLAMAQGGSLTINPDTGLPEAGFLDRMLPTLIGAGLTIASGGALSPLMAAGITGAGYGIAKGSLQEGLMAGLGAYGGAGLASGLSAAGAAGAAGANTANVGAQTAATGADAASKALQAQGAGGANTMFGNYAANTGANIGATGGVQAASLSQPIAQPFATGMQDAGSVMRSGLATAPQATQVALQAPVQQAAQQTAQQAAATAATKAAPVTFDNIKAGFGKATDSWEGLKGVWDKTPTGTGYGLLATGMGIMQDSQNKGTSAPTTSDSYIRPYDYSVAQDPNAYAANASTAERKYFTEPRFTARPIEKVAKEGGLMNLAVGGSVEDMSAMNSVSGNTMYPQSQLQTAMYSNPMVQRPVQNDVINAGLDAPTQPYTGEARMASGGTAKASEPTSEKKYSYDPESMKFTETTITTPAAQSNRFNIPFGMMGANPMMGTGYGIGMMGGPIAQLLAKQQAAPKPTVTTEVTGGIATPFTPEGQAAGAPDTSMVPNTQIQPIRTPEQQLGLESFYANMNRRLAEEGGYAGYAAGGSTGGVSDLGGYSDGGRLLRGPGDGVSDSIPASIGDRQPARLADGEFVVPARIVSELGNGSTEAGARKLYKMMERVQHARRKTVGKNQVAKNTKAEKLMPA